MEALCARIQALAGLEAGLLACHEDFSMMRTLEGLRAVCPVNPVYETTLKRNLVNAYCRQACYEPYRYLYQAEQQVYFDWFLENLRAGNRGEWEKPPQETADALFARFMDTPLCGMRSPCTGDLPAVLTRAAEELDKISF